MAEPQYPPFNEAHPPLMDNAEIFPSHRSDYKIIGAMIVNGADMNRVADPKYPWREFAGSHEPLYIEKIKQILQKRDNEVDHYLLTRRQYWELMERYQYGVDTDVTITRHQGRVQHRSHTVDNTHSVVERVSADLSLDISPGGATAPGEVPPVPPMALVAATGGGNGGGGDKVDLQYSREIHDTLHITDIDETTFTDETTTMTTQRFKGGTTYIYWQMSEECILQRVSKGQTNPDDDPVNTVAARTGVNYTDAFPKSSNGDIH